VTNRGRKPADPKLVEEIERDLRAIRRALRVPLESEIARGDLTAPQLAIMQMVVSHEGTSLKELSRAVGLAHSTTSSIIDRLESKGMLERRADPTDGRITRIHSSAVVKKFVAERLPKLSQSPLEHALNRASRTEQTRIGEAIRRLRELLDETTRESVQEAVQLPR
jgi:MarR family transcriptional regulator, organic hydroperoxide resistance regulator